MTSAFMTVPIVTPPTPTIQWGAIYRYNRGGNNGNRYRIELEAGTGRVTAIGVVNGNRYPSLWTVERFADLLRDGAYVLDDVPLEVAGLSNVANEPDRAVFCVNCGAATGERKPMSQQTRRERCEGCTDLPPARYLTEDGRDEPEEDDDDDGPRMLRCGCGSEDWVLLRHYPSQNLEFSSQSDLDGGDCVYFTVDEDPVFEDEYHCEGCGAGAPDELCPHVD